MCLRSYLLFVSFTNPALTNAGTASELLLTVRPDLSGGTCSKSHAQQTHFQVMFTFYFIPSSIASSLRRRMVTTAFIMSRVVGSKASVRVVNQSIN